MCDCRGLMLIVLLGAIAGCVQPWNTELPTPYATDPRIEQRRFERYDPFPSTDMGPQTFTRPRGYEEPRNPARRTRDASGHQAPAIPGTVHPGVAPPSKYPSSQYPGVVPF